MHDDEMDAVHTGRTVLTSTSVPERAARAHAMKNCISVVRAIAHLVRSDLSPKNAQRMERLDGALGRMTELVNDELAESGPLPIAHRRDRIAVRDLVGSVCEMLYDRAEDARVALLVNCDDGWVWGDEGELREAMFNLIANALEATPAAGAVLVDTCTTPEGDQLWSVQDTGPGIPVEVLQHLGAVRRTMREDGSGIGVPVASDIVLGHGGLVRFESMRNSGTRVTIWLPGAGDPELRPEGRDQPAPW